jgi:RimK family alpha-L-glutamate ligase
VKTRVAVICGVSVKTSSALVEAWRAQGIEAELMTPIDAALWLRAGDVALVRLDVLPTLDGVEPGLDRVSRLQRQGIRVLNPPRALLRAHDKLRTARFFEAMGLPHPRTALVREQKLPELALPELALPLVVKPRFGSWGRDIFLCRTRDELERCLRSIRDRPWFVRHGALVQELVPPRHHDLRLLVADGRVVGASRRIAAKGEWRTNVTLGGTLEPVDPDPAACRLGLAAVAAIGADFVGVDLLPAPDGGHIVLELNGAVDFNRSYSLPLRDVFDDIAAALGLAPGSQVAMGSL